MTKAQAAAKRIVLAAIHPACADKHIERVIRKGGTRSKVMAYAVRVCMLEGCAGSHHREGLVMRTQQSRCTHRVVARRDGEASAPCRPTLPSTEAISSSGTAERNRHGHRPTSQWASGLSGLPIPLQPTLYDLLLTVRLYEKVPPFPAYSNRAREDCLAQPYTGHCALAAVCKFPSRPIGRQQRSLRGMSSDSPERRGIRLAHSTTRLPTFGAPTEMLCECCPLNTDPSSPMGRRTGGRSLAYSLAEEQRRPPLIYSGGRISDRGWKLCPDE